jgi:hypothetical protein
MRENVAENAQNRENRDLPMDRPQKRSELPSVQLLCADLPGPVLILDGLIYCHIRTIDFVNEICAVIRYVTEPAQNPHPEM